MESDIGAVFVDFPPQHSFERECHGHPLIGEAISSKMGWGGPRDNSGGPRANSGGAREGAGRKPNPPVSLAPVDDTERWYCVRTEYQRELTADIEIRRADFLVFNPSLWKPPTKPTRDANGVVRPGLSARIVPLFPRYFFVRFNPSQPQWRAIRYLPGVEMIFSSTPERPIPVPDAAIDRIRAQLHPNGCAYPPSATTREPPLPLGATVRILDGPMVDWTGLCKMSDGKRVEILLQFMGGERLAKMDQTSVEVVR